MHLSALNILPSHILKFHGTWRHVIERHISAKYCQMGAISGDITKYDRVCRSTLSSRFSVATKPYAHLSTSIWSIFSWEISCFSYLMILLISSRTCTLSGFLEDQYAFFLCMHGQWLVWYSSPRTRWSRLLGRVHCEHKSFTGVSMVLECGFIVRAVLGNCTSGGTSWPDSGWFVLSTARGS